ncbi:protein pxr1-like [Willisornis vidua]|uniref:Protein pxr1-like n=1 Tax=Willisornis vidua TaxID=1566151 RepID=A0ABQ9D5Y7_9PASS|nr:protein pxr1-like [Willisornis vidua]
MADSVELGGAEPLHPAVFISILAQEEASPLLLEIFTDYLIHEQSQCQVAPGWTSLLLAKAEPISNGGSAFETEGLRREKRPAQQQFHLQRGVRICESNNSADTRVSEEGGAGDAPGAGADSPAAHGAAHDETAVPLQPMEIHGRAEIHLQPLEDSVLEQVEA